MPRDFGPDVSHRVDVDSRSLVPAGPAPMGHRLTVTGQEPFEFAWRQPEEKQVREGNGDPNGNVTAPKGTLYVERDVPSLWQNSDGLTAWTEIGSGSGDALVFAKQMYGNVNDPGGGAPTDPWPTSADNDYGGVFSNTIDDPTLEEGGWISVNLTDLRSGFSFGLDPDLLWGFINLRLRHLSGTTSESKFQQFAQTDTAADGTAGIDSNAVSPTPRATTEWEALADDGDKAQVIIDCELNAASPQIVLTQIVSGVNANASIMVGPGDPNGAITAAKGSLLMDTGTPAVWQNQDSGTTWTAF